MLYGIISDIHSNLEALTSVLKQLKNVDKIICLGDVVGYGPNPNECVEEIRQLKIPTIAGNHDRAVTKDLVTTWFNANAKAAVKWTQQVITLENLEYLKNLPEVIVEDKFEIVHGSLRSPLEEYITNISEAIPTFDLMTQPLCFIGHTHRPMFIGLKNDGNFDGRTLKDNEEVFVGDYEKVIINVGSVGQPRDRDPRASYGAYNSKTKIFSLHRVAYDIVKVQKKMKAVNLPQFLIDRLATGR